MCEAGYLLTTLCESIIIRCDLKSLNVVCITVINYRYMSEDETLFADTILARGSNVIVSPQVGEQQVKR